jgi:hypothetical protein
MTELSELIRRATPERRPTAVLGRVANTLAQPGDDLYVTVGSFDGHRQRWGPCRWAPRPEPASNLPQRGDDCLVVFDEHEAPWVLVTRTLHFVWREMFNAKGDLVTATANDAPVILAVGTNGQVLVADPAVANGIKWAHLVNAKGDLVTASGPNARTVLPVGASGQLLTADPAVANGIKWASPPAQGLPSSDQFLTSGVNLGTGWTNILLFASLGVGTYLFNAQVMVTGSSGVTVTARIRGDAQGTRSSAQGTTSALSTLALSCVVRIASGTETWQLDGIGSGGGANASDNTPTHNEGAATRFSYVRIAP